MKIAVVGVTGLVGQTMLRILEERDFPCSQLLGVASARSVGQPFSYNGQVHNVISMEAAINEHPDIAIFSAGGSVSMEFAPKFAEVGCFVIDNSSAWRMDPNVPLVVPEINSNVIKSTDLIIANPNCSTIQMVVALTPIQRNYGIKRLVISTYQSYTGTGVVAVNQYNAEKEGQPLSSDDSAYPHPIYANCIPHCDSFLDNDYTKEEMKMVHETRKILQDDTIKITATAVRVPVNGGHSESINVELSQPYEIEEVKELLRSMPGLEVLDDPLNNQYPTPLAAKNKDAVYVGRIRRDDSIENGLNLWVVSDNLRKGAATNAIQIAEYLCESKFVGKQRTAVA